MPITNYRQLEVWAKSMDLAEAIYAAAKHMPKQEEYRLTAQMIRAAISIPANIAEGNLRASRKDYAHFVSIARGSTAELETLVLLAERTKLLSAEITTPLLESIDPIGRMLNRLHSRLVQTTSP
ncbi:MAG: four helix bundle protein [Hyphomonadaceae bacterium]